MERRHRTIPEDPAGTGGSGKLGADALRRQVEEFQARVWELEAELRALRQDRASPIENGFRVIADAVPSPLYVYSLVEERNLWVNAAHRELFGEELASSSRDQILGRVHPDDLEVLATSRKRIEGLADDERLDREYRIRFPNGEWRSFADRCAVFRRDRDGGVTDLIGCAADITEHRLAEQALQEGEARYRELAEMLPETVFEMDADGRITFVNLAALEGWGYSREDYESGVTAFDLLVPEHWDEMRRNLAERYRGVPGPNRYRARRKDGQTFPITIYSRPVFRGGGPAGLLGIVIDDSERERAVEALRESEARFRAVFESAAVGIALVDLEGRIIDANEYDCAFLGYPHDELLGMHFRELTFPDDLEPDQNLYEELMAGRRQLYSLTKRYLRRDGQVVWGDLSVSLIRGPGGQPQYSVAVLRDVTRRHQAEREREELLAEARGFGRRLAEAQEEERRQLARELHDRVGSNLTVLSLEIGHVLASLPAAAGRALAGRLEECLEVVEETGAVIRDVMTGLQPPELDDYGVLIALRSHCARLGARIELRIEVRGDDPDPRPAPAVELALFRIAQEALTNVVRHAEASRVEVLLQDDGSTLELTVSDDGRGIDETTVGERSHSGWGLTTMRERARSVGAAFDCASVPGGGCRVQVTYRRGGSHADRGADRR